MFVYGVIFVICGLGIWYSRTRIARTVLKILIDHISKRPSTPSFDYKSLGTYPSGMPVVPSKTWNDNFCDMQTCFNEKTSENASSTSEWEEEYNTKLHIINTESGSGTGPLESLMKIYSSGSLGEKEASSTIDFFRKIDPNQDVDIVLHTRGGELSSAEVIINAMLNHKGQIRVYIPYFALSAGTLISFAADQICLGKNAYMSPVDGMYGYMSAPKLQRFIESTKTKDFGIVGSLSQLFEEKVELSCIRVYSLLDRVLSVRGYDENAINTVIGTLAGGLVYNHDQPLFYDELSSYVNNICLTVPEEIYSLISKA